MRIAIFMAALLAPEIVLGANPPAPPGVAVVARGHGWLFTDARGMTLYTSERDNNGPNCNDTCAETWPPLVATGDPAPIGAWTTMKRKDGRLQWALQGRPVYTYSVDPAPGATFGDGFGQIWRMALQKIPLPADVTIVDAPLGQVLGDARGLTLYAADKNEPCTGACTRSWRPVEAPALAGDFADWTAVDRGDGVRQWAFRGQPLFRNVGDVVRGEATAANAKGWHAIVLEPAIPPPAWVTVQGSDAGHLYGDERGLTIYTHTPRANAECRDPSCVPPEWNPIIAAADAKPTGDWSLVPLVPTTKQVAMLGEASAKDAASDDSRKQWAFKGSRLYTNTNDRKPGDFRGVRYGGDRSYAAIMLSKELMPGVKGDGESFLQ